MKRISALLIALLVLCCAFSTTAFAAEEKAFWVTHYNDLTAEGAGVIVTTTGLEGGSWNNYYAFAPVEGTDAYEIVEVSIGIGTGAATLPALPEGGFIYSINVGNDYPSLGAGYEGQPNYTSDNCNSMVAEVGNWIVGDQFVFTGLDLEGFTVPTTTADAMWYDAAYVCTATYSAYEGGASTEDPAESTDDSVDGSVEESEDVSEDVSEAVSETESAEESETDTSKEESKAATSTDASEAPAEDDGNTMIWVIVGVVIVVVVVVVIVVAKKKK